MADGLYPAERAATGLAVETFEEPNMSTRARSVRLCITAGRRPSLTRPALESLEARVVPTTMPEIEPNGTFPQSDSQGLYPIPVGDILTTPRSDKLTIAGNIASGGDQDLFKVTLDNSASKYGVFFDLDEVDDTLDSILTLYESTGTHPVIEGNDDGFSFTGFNTPEDPATDISEMQAKNHKLFDSAVYAELTPGTYYIRVTSFGGTTGRYNLRVLADPTFSSTVPALSGQPTATAHTLYLDFDGHSSSSDVWVSGNGNTPYTADPFDLDGNTAVYSPAERLAIQNIFREVEEDFSIFKVNVTTVLPSSFADSSGFRQVITSSSPTILGLGGGTLAAAKADSYATGGSSNNVGFTFADKFGDYGGGFSGSVAAAPVAEANTVSQQFGKALGLSAYSATRTDAIMSSNSKAALNVQVWRNAALPSGSTQDDVAIIKNSANGISGRSDPEGDTRGAAVDLTPLSSSNGFTWEGIITPDDFDVFKFVGSGSTRIFVDVDQYVNNLNSYIRLLSSNGTELATDNGTNAGTNGINSFDALITYDLTAGVTYYAEVSRTGSDYYNGSYTLDINTTLVLPAAQSLSTNEDTDLPGTVSATDLVGLPLTYSITTQPAHGTITSFNGNTGAFVYRPDPDYFNSSTPDSFKFRAKDANNNSNTATVTITVNPVNDPPTFTDAGDQTVNEDTGTHTAAGWATALSVGPANESSQSLTGFVVSSDNTALFSTQPSVSLAGTLNYTLAPDAFGTATVTVRLKDDGGTANGGIDTSVAHTFTLTVLPVNDPPSFSDAGNVTVDEDSGTTTVPNWATNLSRGPANESGQALSFEVLNNNNALFATQPAIDPTGTLTFRPATDAFGTATITVRLHDNGGTANGGSDTSPDHVFTITVRPVNDAPSFTKGPNVRVMDGTASIHSFPGWATNLGVGPANESGQALSFEITGNSDPSLFAAGPAVSGAGALTFTPAADAHGYAVVTLRARDDGGTLFGGIDASPEQSFWIGVNPINQAPVFTKGPDQIVLEDSGPHSVPWATGIGAGSPFESDQVLTFVVTANTNPGLFATQPAVAADGTLSYTSAPNAFGIATITVALADDGGTLFGGDDTSAEQSFTITVVPVNDPPSFALSGPGVTSLEDSGPQVVGGWATAVSAGPPNEAGQGLSFLLGTNNDPLFSVPPAIDAAGTLTYTPAPDAFGTATVTVRLEDDGGTANGGLDTSAPRTFTITVTPVNDVPSFTKGADKVVAEDAGPQTFAGWATAIAVGPANEGGQVLTFHLSTDNNALFAVLPAVTSAGTLTFRSAPNAIGSATVSLYLTDNGGTLNGGVDTSAAQTFTITVTPVNDAPTFTAGPNQTVPEDSGPLTVPGWATNISPGPANEGGQALSFLVSTDNDALFAVRPAIDAAGTLTYTPAPDAFGTATVSVQLMDDGGTASGGADTSPLQTFALTVTPVNDAPVLDAAFDPALSPIPRNSPGTAGDTVAGVVGASITDVDAGAIEGIAVVGSTGEPDHGLWQYSMDGGHAWLALGGPSLASARLLRDTDRVRFIPAIGFVGTVALTYHAWDRTTGTAGATADLTTGTGGTTAFSTASDAATLPVAVTLTSVLEDTKSPRGDTVRSLFADFITDADPNAKLGMAVVGVAGDQIGTWQFSTTGGRSWKPLVPSVGAAVLLRDTDKVRFVPLPNAFGIGSLVYHAWDQSGGTAGGTADLSGPGSTGGATPFSTATGLAFAQVIPVNDLPVLDVGGEPPMTRVPPGATSPAGDLVSALLGSSATDVDGDAVGIAITAVTGTGNWQFLPAGGGWTNLGTVSARAPRLLGPADGVRFVPGPGFAGTAILKYKAWDGTATGKATETATLLVTSNPAGPANNAPVLDTAPTPALASVPEDTRSPQGDSVASLLGAALSDVDANALHGIAVTGVTGAAGGTWQFSLNGGRLWRAVGAVSAANALLLREADRVRFLPGKDFNGSAALTFRAWDQTRGTAGARADLTVSGAVGSSTPFSTGEDAASVTVTPANDAPVLDTRPNRVLTSVLPGATNPAGDLISTILGDSATDVDGDPLGMAVVGVTDSGSWQIQLGGAGAWLALGPVSAVSARLLAGGDRVRLVPAAGFVGTAKLTYKASDGTATSTATDSAALAVNAVDDRPVLDIHRRPALTPVLDGNANPDGDFVSALLGGAMDIDPAAQLGIAVVAATNQGGSWQVMTDGVHWEPLGPVTSKLPRFLHGTDRIRFVPAAGFTGIVTLQFKAWDAASADPDGPLVLSAAVATATVAVNSAPVLTIA